MTKELYPVSYFDLPPDPSPYRTWRGTWKPRPKPHLKPVRVDGEPHWYAIATQGDGAAFCAYAETALEACCQVLGGQQDFWDGRTR
jgi:hypothetical protein